ncbi:MAG: rRNA maturation RNase YbeY [Melioribacteraceae bacterium]|nr:rRNA maturation RNase YbeY [Melioribacteraceae bacterium]MCF8352915.1 rRNA maturation RNase YbeY [Melioribacteraceae bacterium]MCF8395256.1 rRNA maturation RNase YbeY [Melioribacteraceae bacterium]MCF8417432.1 rRNA maturation RNase YbeY [Melioribacteraceae bacterium]
MIKNVYTSVDKRFTLNRIRIHSLISALIKHLSFRIDTLVINFVSQEKIFEINSEYLSHFYTTDIITFNYSGKNNNLDAEIFISYIDAQENANKYNCSFNSEIIRLIIHGILHLLGYDDTDQKKKAIMKRKEDELVKLFSHYDLKPEVK